jgi:hypothetical protein
MIEENNIQSLSQLLRRNYTRRSISDAVPIYSWKQYFKKDYTFSSYNLKKQKTKDHSVAVNEEHTASDLRSILLCSMIKLHNSLYEVSSDYKGILKCCTYEFINIHLFH